VAHSGIPVISPSGTESLEPDIAPNDIEDPDRPFTHSRIHHQNYIIGTRTMLAHLIPSSSRLNRLTPFTRTFTTFPTLLASRKTFDRPSPPPLPPSDQAEFDALLKANQSIGASPAVTAPAEELQHRDLRRGPKKDFEGDENPKTGEMGGPKVDPFKAGDGDWQYGGRVTVSAWRFRVVKVSKLTIWSE